MLDSPIIEFDSIDSTNKYAMQLIDANKAYHGLTIVAQSQTEGKGQRGKIWLDTPGQSLLMSVIINPAMAISAQFTFNAFVAVSVADVLSGLFNKWDLRVKWPNDIIINDKKAGGILIENILRGSRWSNSVVGLGLNVKQAYFPPELPFATSLKAESGEDFDMISLRESIRIAIAGCNNCAIPPSLIMKKYNEYLYRKGQKQAFSNGSGSWEATIIEAATDGGLLVQLADGSLTTYYHGQVLWEW